MSEKSLSRIARRREDIAGGNPAEERLLEIATALAGELAIARERIDTLERLLEASGTLDRADIEAFQPTDPQAEERRQIRKRIIAKVFRPLREAAERDVISARQTNSNGHSADG